MADKFLAFVKNKDSAAAFAELAISHELSKESVVKGNIQTAIELLAKTPKAPEFMVVELSSKNQDEAFSELDKLASVCDPSTQVLVLGDVDELSFYKKIIDMGVAEYILNPATPKQLEKIVSTVKTAKKTDGEKAASKIIAVVGTRGGVGASSIALNLAALLAEKKHKTAILDLDPEFGTIPLMLDVEPSRGLVDALEKPERVDSLFLDRAMSKVTDHLFVLGAERAIGEVGKVHPDAITTIVGLLKPKFEYIIIDVSQIQEHEFQILKTSSCIVVTELSIPGLRDTMRVNDLIKEQLGNKDITIIANKTGLNKKFETPQKDFEQGLGRKIDFVMPYDAESYGFYDNGKVTSIARRDAKFSKSLEQLAGIFLSGKGKNGAATKKGLLEGFLSRKS